ncbi:MAG: hypothetical protein ACP5UO_00755 [Thermoplasmata archaeon]
MQKITVFLLIAVLFIMTAGAGYITGISVKNFAITAKDHFVSLFRMMVDFFQVF